ncbi:MAG TPA: type II toxin-antitoxin system RelE/ParE family toxin [Trebonia sp.]|jgi:mRNA interferase RelE/StbE|nr:type II toxin-antitoxin system RelE/ParE family toxin [Trebonia sp.]
MTYRVIVQPRARKAFLSLDGPVRKRVGAAIDGLAEDPRPPGARALTGLPGALRIRVSDYRIVYTVQDDQLIVLVIDIGHRREIYR